MLEESLTFTRERYIQEYGALEHERQPLVFTHQSKKHLQPGGRVMTIIGGMLQVYREEGRGAILVMKGWGGLSTDFLSARPFKDLEDVTNSPSALLIAI